MGITMNMADTQSSQPPSTEKPKDAPKSHTTPETAGPGSIQHWSTHGRRPELAASPQRVSAGDWKTEPFSTPVTSAWDVIIPPRELPKLLNGFQPQEMEDKWFVYADGPDTEGHAWLHMFRSWTGYKVAEVGIKVPTDGDGSVFPDYATMDEIIWEKSEERIRGQDEEGAKRMVLEVCRWVLGAELPGMVGDEENN